MKKPAIPAVPLGASNRDVLLALKESVELLTGQRGEKLTLLTSTATLAEVISRVNKIIETLQNLK